MFSFEDELMAWNAQRYSIQDIRAKFFMVSEWLYVIRLDIATRTTYPAYESVSLEYFSAPLTVFYSSSCFLIFCAYATVPVHIVFTTLIRILFTKPISSWVL